MVFESHNLAGMELRGKAPRPRSALLCSTGAGALDRRYLRLRRRSANAVSQTATNPPMTPVTMARRRGSPLGV